MAWTFFIGGLGFYAFAVWLYFANHLWWGLGSGFVGSDSEIESLLVRQERYEIGMELKPPHE